MQLEQLDNQYRVTGFGYATDWYPDKNTALAEAMLHQLGEIKALAGHLPDDSQTVKLRGALMRTMAAIQSLPMEAV